MSFAKCGPFSDLRPSKPTITIEESCDSFSIIIKDNKSEISYYFSQKDAQIKNLVNVFKKLGFEAKYEECY